MAGSRRPNVGPTSAKSADLATNSQRRSDGGMLSGLADETTASGFEHRHTISDNFPSDISAESILEQSFKDIHLDDTPTTCELTTGNCANGKQNQVHTEDTEFESVMFGLEKFIVPPLLTRHPMPFAGRDDDITELKEILDDILTKLGYNEIDACEFPKIALGLIIKLEITLSSSESILQNMTYYN